MSQTEYGRPRGWKSPIILLVIVLGIGVGLAAWKKSDLAEAQAASANQPEPMEAIEVAIAVPQEHRRTTTSIGTVLALQSVALRNEIAGTVRDVSLTPGAIVNAGAVLVALDVSVEEAELQAQQAQADLAETLLRRMQNLLDSRAVSATDVDRARAERDVALAQIARTKAIIGRKTIRAPFRARVGVSDVHPGQYLEAGTLLTTLQGLEPSVHVDFDVGQAIAAGLHEGDRVHVFPATEASPLVARIVAVDSRVDPATRNALVRARLNANGLLTPGSSVRVEVPVGEPILGVAVPASALRKGPAGDHVFVIAEADDGRPRAHLRPVRVRALLGDMVIIESGLSAGERVAATGSFKLYESVLVAVTNEAQPAGQDSAGQGTR